MNYSLSSGIYHFWYFPKNVPVGNNQAPSEVVRLSSAQWGGETEKLPSLRGKAMESSGGSIWRQGSSSRILCSLLMTTALEKDSQDCQEGWSGSAQRLENEATFVYPTVQKNLRGFPSLI